MRRVGGDISGLVSFWEYGGVARKVILKLKFRLVSDLVEEAVGPHFAKATWGKKRFKGFVVVPVPLSDKRWRWRGFNQAEEIGRVVAREWKLGMSNLLIKVKDTGQQVGKSKRERLESVKNSFALNPKFEARNPKLQKVLLVDDVWTSGATMREAARALKRAGVKRIWGLTLARRVWRE